MATPQPERTPHQFDPSNLTRSVIAVPLLEQIEREEKTTNRIVASHPGIRESHNAAIFLRTDYPGGLAAALAAVRQLLPTAIRRARAKGKQTIDEPDSTISDHVALAWLDDTVIRQLVGLDATRLPSESENTAPAIDRVWPARLEVIIDLNLAFRPLETDPGKAEAAPPDPRVVARALVERYVKMAIEAADTGGSSQGINEKKTALSNQYVFATLEGKAIKELVRIDQREAEELLKKAESARGGQARQALGKKKKPVRGVIEKVPPLEISRFRTIHSIWPDFEIRSCITNSIRTVKVDAAQRSFAALGTGVTWAVMDTGIDGLHPHFSLHANIDPTSPDHADFTNAPGGPQPLKDDFGHGTHVAGIIAGEQSTATGAKPKTMVAVSNELDSNGKSVARTTALDAICGMASKCKLVSLKVLDEFGIGKASNVIAAIAHVQTINGHGRDLKIHGVNLSLGHVFDPKWFACGHSPLCVEVNRLVKSGVVVVVAAGNTGYGTVQTKEGSADTCLDLTINDPGNAEYAITVGSTHRDMPHMYGVSYFSSKGPTGDGRCKPDLLAPGEKIVSCASDGSTLVQRGAGGVNCNYFETSGTSMAAPHVSGAIAAFLSIRPEFIGEAEKVKQIFVSTATDLGRDRYFQGAGLVDLMRAIQSV